MVFIESPESREYRYDETWLVTDFWQISQISPNRNPNPLFGVLIFDQDSRPVGVRMRESGSDSSFHFYRNGRWAWGDESKLSKIFAGTTFSLDSKAPQLRLKSSN